MRHSEFWRLAEEEFGAGYARSLAADLVIGALGSRTAQAALDAGEDPRAVWFALCDAKEVPRERRLGKEPKRRRGA